LHIEDAEERVHQPYSYARTSRTINRAALRDGTILATTDSASTTTSQMMNPHGVRAIGMMTLAYI
jgi:hypothetical protein